MKNLSKKLSINLSTFDLVVLSMYIFFCMVPASFNEKGIDYSGLTIGTIGFLLIMRLMHLIAKET